MKIVKKTCLAQQMTEKIAVEVDAKIYFGKKYKNQQKLVFLLVYFLPNIKPYSERFLFEFYENNKQKLPSTIND